MKNELRILAVFSALIFGACGEKSVNTGSPVSPKPTATITNVAAATPVPTSSVTKNGDYDGKGVVTKINLELGSVEMDHEEIKGVMPPMRMEFYVSDKKMLDGLKVGDKVDFVLRYKDYTETVVKINKAP